MLAGLLSLSLSIGGGYLTVDGVYINQQGPFRFLLDTGAQSTVLDPRVAEQLALRPTYRVEVVSVNQTQWAPGTVVASVTCEEATAHQVEALWYPIHHVQRLDPAIAGILGQSFLSRFRYLIDVRRRVFRLNPEEPSGRRVPLKISNGRPVIVLDGLHLVLDSGTVALVLFGKRRPPHLLANVPVVYSPPRVGGEDGLLPLALFDSVYIDPAEGYAILNARK